MSPDVKTRIEADILSAYQNSREPDFSFVATALDRPRHASVVAALVAAGFTVADTTDANDDVAWHLHLQRNSTEVYLALSMVGDFATLGDSAPSKGRSELEALVRTYGWTVLSPADLGQPTSLWLDGTHATVGQALFAVLPECPPTVPPSTTGE